MTTQPRGALFTYDEILGAVARGWTTPANEAKTVDPVLAEAIAHEIQDLLSAGAEEEEPVVYSLPDIDGKCWPITALQCADWLDKKYARHHEEEDKAGAAWLRYYAGNTPPASAAGEFVLTDQMVRDWCDRHVKGPTHDR